MSKIIEFRAPAGRRPANVLRKVPGRPRNRAVRSREYMTLPEIEALLVAAGQVGRHRLRDRTLLLMGFRHGLRVSEVIDLRWDAIDFRAGRIHVSRLKGGNPATHYLEGDELRLLRRLRRESLRSPFIFVTERGGPLTRSTVSKFTERAGRLAKLGFPVHFHMLRHSTGFALADRGTDTRVIQDYLGHKSIAHTVRYTQLAPHRFRGLWR